MKLPATLRALQYRNFQLFFSGQLISLIGTWMQNMAQAWLVYRLTGSSVLLGAVGFSGQIPVLLFSPPAGLVADRYPRRRVVIATQAASMLLAFILAALTLGHMVHIWHIFVLSALLGVVNAFDIPARQSLLVEMVDRADLMNAIALNSSMFNASRIVGPAIAAALVAGIGEGWCFFANGASYIAVIVGLSLLRVAPGHAPARHESPLSNLKEGFRFVFHNTPVHALLVLLGLVSLAGGPYIVLMPIFAGSVLHGGARVMGWLLSASGMGALAGALLLASRENLKGLGRWVAIAATCFSVTLVVFSLSRTFWLSASILALVGFFMMVQMGASNTLIQSMVPDRLRGRVMSVYSMVLMGMAPIGSLLAGAVAGKVGAPLTVAGGGVLCLVAAGFFWKWLPQVRVSARRLIVAQQMAAGEPPQGMTGGTAELEAAQEER